MDPFNLGGSLPTFLGNVKIFLAEALFFFKKKKNYYALEVACKVSAGLMLSS